MRRACTFLKARTLKNFSVEYFGGYPSELYRAGTTYTFKTQALAAQQSKDSAADVPTYNLVPIGQEDTEVGAIHDDQTGSFEYVVRVTTGSCRGAGTPSMATMQLFGTLASSALYRIGDEADNNGGPGFLRGSTKQYSIREARLGRIKRVGIRKDMQRCSELGSGWFLDSVVVTGPDALPVTFPCKAWIGEPDDVDSASKARFERERILLPNQDSTSGADSAGSQGLVKPAPEPVSIRASGVAIPHPAKVKDGKRGVNKRSSGFAGEDAYFYTPGSDAVFGLGVSDGVYIWREYGIDSGVLSKALMDTASMMVEGGCSDVKQIAEAAGAQIDQKGINGSATFCLAVVERDKALMHTACLGDSGIMVIGATPENPEPRIKFRTDAQEHEFGNPYQLGHLPTHDKPDSAMLASVDVLPGDIVIVASDGLWDNLFDREIVETAMRHQAASSAPNPTALVRELASTAYAQSQDRSAFTPYSSAASEWFDMVYNGGKKDDIAIVAAFVER